nr:PREDICTED: tumor necrosis factor receptor superfamily member 10B-like isoform X2 [Rhinolophus sinicus]
MAHPNREAYCLPCTQCREDQKEVTSCHPTRDRQCQCMPGIYYCDSVDCMEQCYRCTRCPSCKDGGHSGRLLWCNGATLHACNATSDAICAAERNPVPGNANMDSSVPVPVWVLVVVGIVVIVCVIVSIYCCRRQCAPLSQQVVNFLKEKSSTPGSYSWSSSLPNEILPPMGTERLPPAIGVNTSLLDEGSSSAPRARTPPPTFEDPEDGIELQVLVARGSDTAPAPAPAPAPTLQAQAPAACGPQPRAEASAPLSGLQQEYEHKYYLKDTSCDGTNRIYYEFGHKVPERNWKMLMRFVGLEDNDIEICEHENAGNLVEQHHKMLVRWRNKLGREASVFKLLAALHTMGLHVCLQNIVNTLVAENILGRHAETSG